MTVAVAVGGKFCQGNDNANVRGAAFGWYYLDDRIAASAAGLLAGMTGYFHDVATAYMYAGAPVILPHKSLSGDRD